jgi:hypothetical protein
LSLLCSYYYTLIVALNYTTIICCLLILFLIILFVGDFCLWTGKYYTSLFHADVLIAQYRVHSLDRFMKLHTYHRAKLVASLIASLPLQCFYYISITLIISLKLYLRSVFIIVASSYSLIVLLLKICVRLINCINFNGSTKVATA